ncbi:heavy-metal-associated domain-containing protein [Methanolobus halotolerans]|uniref:Copper resistance protein CopZ n=1 Tax=Methanolobus halotolerans TaxID=2052935 RepID=A0A4E0PW88_9EURY|nr:cation transporter [Methanolobus halotolerans]TGC09725.1 copper resistance protein CopZ [Methanolobus halotolerans]
MTVTEESIRIEGMSCGHCQATVDKAIRSVEGVQDVTVDLGEKQARVVYDPTVTNITVIKSAISNAGYDVIQ